MSRSEYERIQSELIICWDREELDTIGARNKDQILALGEPAITNLKNVYKYMRLLFNDPDSLKKFKDAR